MGGCEKAQRCSKGRNSNQDRRVGAYLGFHGALEGGFDSLVWPRAPQGQHPEACARAEVTCGAAGDQRVGATGSTRGRISYRRGAEGKESPEPLDEGRREEGFWRAREVGAVDVLGGKAQGGHDEPEKNSQCYEPDRVGVGGGCGERLGGEDGLEVVHVRMVEGSCKVQIVQRAEQQPNLHRHQGRSRSRCCCRCRFRASGPGWFVSQGVCAVGPGLDEVCVAEEGGGTRGGEGEGGEGQGSFRGVEGDDGVEVTHKAGYERMGPPQNGHFGARLRLFVAKGC